MNKLLVLLSLVVCGLLLGAASADQDMNPNGSSELSLLMRKMEKQLVDARPEVLNDKYRGTYPAEFDKLKTAAPTDAETKTEYYNVFADLYTSSVKSLYASKKYQVQAYNNVVNACLACHSQHCPGPVGRIRKLMITQ
jgi:cytochrome c556